VRKKLGIARRGLPDGSREAPGPRGLLHTIARRRLATIAAVEAEAERIGMGRNDLHQVPGTDTPKLLRLPPEYEATGRA
jgi:hypothetical protein